MKIYYIFVVFISIAQHTVFANVPNYGSFADRLVDSLVRPSMAQLPRSPVQPLEPWWVPGCVFQAGVDFALVHRHCPQGFWPLGAGGWVHFWCSMSTVGAGGPLLLSLSHFHGAVWWFQLHLVLLTLLLLSPGVGVMVQGMAVPWSWCGSVWRSPT